MCGGDILAKKQCRYHPSEHKDWKRLFAQPSKTLYGKTSVYLCENDLEIENFHQIIDCGPEQIRVQLSAGVLTVTGEQLKIIALEKHRLRLRGWVLKTEFSYETIDMAAFREVR